MTRGARGSRLLVDASRHADRVKLHDVRVGNLRAILFAALSCLLAAGCTLSAHSGSESPGLSNTSSLPQADCPSDLLHVRVPHVPGMDDVLVPGSPERFDLCTNGKVTGVSSDQAQAVRVQSALDRLPLLPTRNLSGCPGDTAPTYGLFFHYPNGTVVLVRYSPRAAPCLLVTVSNGRRTAVAGEAVRRVILGAVGRG